MPAATVLIPTHSHAAPLRIAVASVQAQTLQDFELLIVGDGVTNEVRAVARALAAEDPRIRFLDFPKGERKGERHRHAALQEASGRFVAYLGDDDIWFPEHLAVLDELLREADFGATLHIGLDSRGEPFVLAAALGRPYFRRLMRRSRFNRFDLTFGGHTLDAYRRLPEGWRTTPPHFPWTDLWMWRQFLAQPWCRAATAIVPTGICTQTHLRPRMDDEARAAELAAWLGRAAAPGFREEIWRFVARDLNRQLITWQMRFAWALRPYGAARRFWRWIGSPRSGRP